MTIQLKKVTKKYPPKTIYESFSLSIDRGEIVGLHGPNGSGKTTFLKLICGLILPDSGEVEVLGKKLLTHRHKLMTEVGVILEGSRNLYWRLTGIQNILYFSGLKKYFGKEVHSRAAYWLKFFNLWEVRNSPVFTYSRGMKQKLSIICALVTNPKLLLFDEPFLGIDAETKEKIVGLIQLFAKNCDSTIVIASHHEELLTQVVTRTIFLQDIHALSATA